MQTWIRGRMLALGTLLILYLAGVLLLSAVTLYEPRNNNSTPSKNADNVQALHSNKDYGRVQALRPSLRRARLAWCSGLKYLNPPRYPTALASFPGSGNTWLRYLLQQATGIYTGSVYKDYGLLKNGFPAESVVNGSVLVVKTHEWGPRSRSAFAKAVLLVRAPGPAIQAEFNRQSGGHVGFASPDRYKRTKGRYWQQFVTDKLSAWKQTNLDWLKNFSGPTHVLFYEKLVEDVESNLKSLLTFLDMPASSHNIGCALERKEGIYRRRKRVLNFDPYTKQMKKMLKDEQDRGAANLCGSFFSCIPICSSLARSTVQVQLGGMSQISSLVACTVLLLLILWIGPVFQFLPRCILASVIMVSLTRLFLQVRDLPRFWKLSKMDALLWVITFLTVVLLDVDYGLIAGVFTSVLLIFYLNCKPHTSLVSSVPGTEFYLDKQRFLSVEDVDRMKIFRYCGQLNFGTVSLFRSALSSKLHFDIKHFLVESRVKNAKLSTTSLRTMVGLPFQCLILDLTAVKCIDPTGAQCLEEIYNDFQEVDIQVLFAGLTGTNYDMLENYKNLCSKDTEFTIFPTTHDAVLFAKANVT